MPLNQSHISYSGCFLTLLCLSPTFLQHLSLCWFSLSCFLSPCALSVFLCSPSFFFSLPITSCLLCTSQHLSFQRIAQAVDSQRQQNAFTLRGSFASHSWCGGEPACSHRGRGGERKRPVLESHNCEVNQHFVFIRRNMHRTD